MQIGISTGDRHGVSRADSTPGHGDTPRAGQGGDGTPDAPTTSPKDPSFEEALGSADEQPHSGKHAADTPATHTDEAANARKAGHDSGDAHGSGKADADAQHGHDSAEHADADPKAKDHSANGKADDAADSARHGDKTEADKAETDKPPRISPSRKTMPHTTTTPSTPRTPTIRRSPTRTKSTRTSTITHTIKTVQIPLTIQKQILTVSRALTMTACRIRQLISLTVFQKESIHTELPQRHNASLRKHLRLGSPIKRRCCQTMQLGGIQDVTVLMTR